MANRSVLQWDKDDCAAAGLVKFDLLGLGMLSALHYMMDLVAEHKGITVDLAQTRSVGNGGVRDAAAGRFGGGVPSGITCADGDTAASEASKLLRPGSRGRAHPSGADSRRISASVHSSAQQTPNLCPTTIRRSRRHSNARWGFRCSRNS